jgi:apolipoprotein N-acyltransferase
VLVFLVPFIKWAFTAPRWRTYLLAALAAGWGSWFCILIWLRHIYPPWGWLGLLLLSGYLGLYALAWLAAMRWAAPRLMGVSRARRLAGLVALAGWWIVLDWVRGWLFSGFPWLPLAAAFWEFPLLLQVAEWTGQWGVTFMIVLFNLGLVCGTGPEPAVENAPPPRRKIWWPARCGPELLLPLGLFMGAVLLSLQLLSSKQRKEVPLLRAGIVQPATPALLKWDLDAEDKNRDTLFRLTQTFAYRDRSRNNVDLVLWPEAALPVYFQGSRAEPDRQALDKIVVKLGVPLLLGGVGEAYPPPGEKSSPGMIDGVFFVRPGAGFAEEVYLARHLVPFGEYIPLRQWLPFLGKAIPLDADTVPGNHAVTIPLTLANGHTVHAGPLVCFDEIFPNLARDQARAGADFLVVVANDAWYGNGGEDQQHAAHSILLAIETRRPVVRCANNGWSGFIDQDGDAFPLEKNNGAIKSGWVLTAPGTTHFQGAGALYLYTNPQFDGLQTFYVRFGDWFVALSALLALAGALVLKTKTG